MYDARASLQRGVVSGRAGHCTVTTTADVPYEQEPFGVLAVHFLCRLDNLDTSLSIVSIGTRAARFRRVPLRAAAQVRAALFLLQGSHQALVVAGRGKDHHTECACLYAPRH